MTLKLVRSFYQRPALEIVKDFLGKFLVFQSPKGKVSGKIVDVEVYPAFVDGVSHANKRTSRTEVCYREGGFAYVYLIYGKFHQFAVVVNKKEIPDVVFIRALIPDEGIEIIRENFGKPVKSALDLTKSPGNLCKSFGIDLCLYGADLTGDTIWLEDRGEKIKQEDIKSSSRIGIDSKLEGSSHPYRFMLR